MAFLKTAYGIFHLFGAGFISLLLFSFRLNVNSTVETIPSTHFDPSSHSSAWLDVSNHTATITFILLCPVIFVWVNRGLHHAEKNLALCDAWVFLSSLSEGFSGTPAVIRRARSAPSARARARGQKHYCSFTHSTRPGHVPGSISAAHSSFFFFPLLTSIPLFPLLLLPLLALFLLSLTPFRPFKSLL